MSNEEDECDSSSLLPVASQSDVSSYLHAQAAKITGLNSSISDDDDSSIDDQFLTRFTQLPTKKTAYLSRSCFASISSQKQSIADDLTELKWLSTFKLKEFQENKIAHDTKDKPLRTIEDQISKLSNELKTYDQNNRLSESIPFGVLIFLALYSTREEKQTPWSMTIKQIYEYLQNNMKSITQKRGWKNLLKQTLSIIPCFVKTKHDTPKARSTWTIDPYYRPLLTKAYLSNVSLQTNKVTPINSNESIVNNFAPKATMKTKALPRLYERLCEEKVDGDEADSNQIIKHQAERKRPRSTSSGQRQSTKNDNEKRLSSSSPWLTKHHDPKISPKKRLEPSVDDDDDDAECDSHASIRSTRKSIITTRSQAAARGINRRKSSPPRKRLSLGLPSHRPNTRINRKIIEQDLELLRQAQPLDLSNRPLAFEESSQIPADDILDLSVSR